MPSENHSNPNALRSPPGGHSLYDMRRLSSDCTACVESASQQMYTSTVAHQQHRTCVPLLGQWSVTSGGIFSHPLVLSGNCSLVYVLMQDYCCNHEGFFFFVRDFSGLLNGKGGGRFCESFCE